MQRRGSISGVLWTTLASALIVLMGVAHPTAAQEQDAPAKTVAAKKAKKPSGRLPNYYKDVVSRQQREQIYAIQAEYREKIAALKAQLAAMTKEQNEKIAAVLSAEQIEKVEQLKAEAAAKRKKAAAEKKPATEK